MAGIRAIVSSGLTVRPFAFKYRCVRRWRSITWNSAQNGKVIRTFDLGRDHRHFDAEGTLDLGASGWLLLRAWNDGADPIILDLYPYATTNPVTSNCRHRARMRAAMPRTSSPGWIA